MCGFSFCISKTNISLKEIKLMNKKISHRGPDKEKFISSKNIKSFNRKFSTNFLAGFRRLKIIDLSSKANQPMLYTDRYFIIFNGEIYNYIEIKEILKKKKYIFKTKSDTEVILAAYDFWGSKCFNYFNGMWSLIIFDLKKNKFVACRDRYGVKPLYYTKLKNSYYFSSEVKQLLSLNKKNQINKQTLSRYLYDDLSSNNEQTFIKNIYQVKPGNYVDFNAQNFKLKKINWYKFKKKKFKRKNIKGEISEILEKSVRLRLRSDVKIGISLSGGIDSSTIASIIANIKKKSYKKIYTFSSRSKDENDEYNYVKEFNKKYKFKNIPITLKFENFKNDFLKIVKQHDQPISNLSIFSEWEVFKKLKSKRIKVNIDGHGADEQLCGFENYFSLYILECIKKFKLNLIYKFFKQLFFSNIKNKFYFMMKVFFNLLPSNIINILKDLNRHNIKNEWINLKPQKIQRKIFHKNLVLNQNYLQFFFTSLPKQLNWSDINSMSHSIETRSPFMDYNFVERILPLSMEHKINGIKSKYALREAYKLIIPKKIYQRNFKVGFSAPGELWTKNNKKFIEKMFKYYFNYLEGILSLECKYDAIKIIKGKYAYRDWIWKVIFLGAWIKHHKISL